MSENARLAPGAGRSETTSLNTLAHCLLGNGYLLVPIKPGTKEPAGTKWQNSRHTAATLAPDHGVGILTGQGDHPVIGVDIDVSNAAICAALVAWCEKNIGYGPQRIGAAPRILLAYRAPEAGWIKATSSTFVDPAAPLKPNGEPKIQKIEVLAKGQQFVAYAIHPDTGRLYEWVDTFGGLEHFHACDLPIITLGHVAALFAEMLGLIGEHGYPVKEGSNAPSEAHPLLADVRPVGVTREQACKDVPLVPGADDYDTWIKVGMALHHEAEGAAWALELWDEWSKGSPTKYKPGDCADKWRGFGKSTGRAPITYRTIQRLVPEPAIPKARHWWTDQANAERLAKHYGGRLMVAADEWYAWDGTRWAAGIAEPQRLACTLSNIINAEHDAWKAKTPVPSGKDKDYEDIDEGWGKWSARSEMRATLDAVLALLKRLLGVKADTLNADPWLLNCPNGTVDLRTGTMRAHDPADLITLIAACDFVPGAPAPTFHKALALASEAPFLLRWFGYCATGSTREHKFAVHYGVGSNGKSTILETVAGVLGEYATTAAPGLLVSSGKDRHPTEIADLFGRRMVTAHESGDGGTLREDFVKQATGGDRLKARHMREDFFEFSPTHKLQLLTNHKPQIRGTDQGIWRRVLLIPYLARFGEGGYPKDPDILTKLHVEREGVLAAIVRGAAEWYRGGLNPPDNVLAAGNEYREEQDRIGQFLAECCEVGAAHSVLLTTERKDGLFQVYRSWCDESDFHNLSKTKFLQEIARLPGYRKERQQVDRLYMPGRRDALRIHGLRVL